MRLSPETNCLPVQVDQTLVLFVPKPFNHKGTKFTKRLEVDFKMLFFVFFMFFVFFVIFVVL